MLPNVELQFRHNQHLEKTAIPQGMNHRWKGDTLKPLDNGPDIIDTIILPWTVAGIIVEIDDQSLIDLICIDVNGSRAICERASAAVSAALLCRLMIAFAVQIGAESAVGAWCDFVVFKKRGGRVGFRELNQGGGLWPHRSREPDLVPQRGGLERQRSWGTFSQGSDALSEA